MDIYKLEVLTIWIENKTYPYVIIHKRVTHWYSNEEKHNTSSSISYLRNCLKLITHAQIYTWQIKHYLIYTFHQVCFDKTPKPKQSLYFPTALNFMAGKSGWVLVAKVSWTLQHKHIVTETFNRNGKVLTHPHSPPKTTVVSCLLSMFGDLYKPMLQGVGQKRSEIPEAPTILEMRSLIDSSSGHRKHDLVIFSISNLKTINLWVQSFWSSTINLFVKSF